MPLFSRKPRICPLCDAEVPGSRNDVVGHVLTHIDDSEPGNVNGGLRLFCGCPEAVWPVGANFPEEARLHLERSHGMKSS